MGEYVDENLKRKLQEKLNLPVAPEKNTAKRKSVLEPEDDNLSNANKKPKVSTDNDAVPLEDYGSSNSLTPINKVIGWKLNLMLDSGSILFTHVFFVFVEYKSYYPRKRVTEGGTRDSFTLQVFYS